MTYYADNIPSGYTWIEPDVIQHLRVGVCRGCGALIHPAATESHSAFHLNQDRRWQEVVERIGSLEDTREYWREIQANREMEG